MILVLRTDATPPQIDHILERVVELGFEGIELGQTIVVVSELMSDRRPGSETSSFLNGQQLGPTHASAADDDGPISVAARLL